MGAEKRGEGREEVEDRKEVSEEEGGSRREREGGKHMEEKRGNVIVKMMQELKKTWKLWFRCACSAITLLTIIERKNLMKPHETTRGVPVTQHRDTQRQLQKWILEPFWLQTVCLPKTGTSK